MAYAYEELKRKNLAELRDIAKDLQDDAVQGFTQMNKEHLLPALCAALGVDAREHHAAHGEGKATARAHMHDLKKRREAAVEAGDKAALRAIRREYHHWNHMLRVDARRP